MLFQPIVVRFALIGQFIFFIGNRSLAPDIVEKHTNNTLECISISTDVKQDFDMKSVRSFDTTGAKLTKSHILGVKNDEKEKVK